MSTKEIKHIEFFFQNMVTFLLPLLGLGVSDRFSELVHQFIAVNQLFSNTGAHHSQLGAC